MSLTSFFFHLQRQDRFCFLGGYHLDNILGELGGFVAPIIVLKFWQDACLFLLRDTGANN
jgi:hypothetical protein